MVPLVVVKIHHGQRFLPGQNLQLTRTLALRIMLSGFKSQWIMDSIHWSCRYASPLVIPKAMLYLIF
jgi:hypothetical protein